MVERQGQCGASGYRNLRELGLRMNRGFDLG